MMGLESINSTRIINIIINRIFTNIKISKFQYITMIISYLVIININMI